MGRRMSGGEHWARVEPSVNSTIECTIDCGCTTTSIAVNGRSNRRCASISSRPLFTRVAELMVTTGPIRQVGCASACAGVTVAKVGGAPTAKRPAAGRQDQPAHLGCTAAAKALGKRGMLGIDRHDLTWLRDGLHERAADDQRLLVGERQGVARSQCRQGRGEADRAGHAVQHGPAGRRTVGQWPARDIGGGVGSDQQLRWGEGDTGSRRRARQCCLEVGAAPRATPMTSTLNSTAWSASRSSRSPPLASPTTRNRSGLRRITSRAWVPIDPVHPKMTTSLRWLTSPVSRTGPFRGCDRSRRRSTRPPRGWSTTARAAREPTSSSHPAAA